MDRPEDANPYAYPPSAPTAPNSPAAKETSTATAETRPLLSGDTLVAILLGLCVIAAFGGWLYHYEYRRVPQTFWGFESPKIFREAKRVTAYLIRPEGVGVAEKPQYYDTLFMVDELRYVVVKKKDLVEDAGLPRVRAMLNDYTNYQQSYATWSNPNWRFVLEFHYKSEDPHQPGDYTAVIVFDDECKLGRPQSVKKVIGTDPMAADLQAYFEGLFPEAKDLKNSANSNVFTRPLNVETEPTPTASATGSIPSGTVTTDSEVVTTPSPVPSSTTPGVTPPTTFGPSQPSFNPPPSSAFAIPEPAPTPTATPTPTAVVAKPPEPSGPSVFATPPKVGPAVVPQVPGLPGMPTLGGPTGPLVPGTPSGAGGINLNLNGPLNPPTSPLYQGVPQPGSGLNNLSAPTPISVPVLQGVPAAPKPSGTK